MNLYTLDGGDNLGVSEVASSRRLTISSNPQIGNVFEKVDTRDSNISHKDRNSSVQRSETHSTLLDGLKWSLDRHSQMKKLHSEEEARRVSAFIDCKAQKH